MKIILMSVISGVILALSACTTTDTPTVTPPALFQGSAGLNFIEGQFDTKPSGMFKVGEIFSEGQVKHTRTGTLLNDLTYYEP